MWPGKHTFAYPTCQWLALPVDRKLQCLGSIQISGKPSTYSTGTEITLDIEIANTMRYWKNAQLPLYPVSKICVILKHLRIRKGKKQETGNNMYNFGQSSNRIRHSLPVLSTTIEPSRNEQDSQGLCWMRAEEHFLICSTKHDICSFKSLSHSLLSSVSQLVLDWKVRETDLVCFFLLTS